MKRLNGYPKKTRLIFYLLILFVLVFPVKTNARSYDISPKNVLVIFSYSPTYPSAPILLSGINTIFEDYPINLQIEYLDSKLTYNEDSKHIFKQSLMQKIDAIGCIDLVITFDDNALNFINENYESLFGSNSRIPVLFEGYNHYENAYAIIEKRSNFAGLLEGSDRHKTIESAILLNPNYETINVIIDNSTTSKAVLREYEATDHAINFINTEDFTYDEVVCYLQTLTVNDILIFESGYSDINGTHMTYDQITELIYDHVNTPIYCNTEYKIPEFFAGGYVSNRTATAKMVAQMTCDILFSHHSPSEYGLNEDLDSTMSYMYNASILSKYNISVAVLPSSTVLLNNSRTMLFNKPSYVALFIAICAILGVLIALLISFAIRKHKHAIEHEKVAHTDHLTNAGSRMAFYIKAKRAIDDCMNSDNKNTLIFFDLDRFKEINDKFGHSVGDIVLQSTIQRIQNTIKNYGEIFRYGGDEFIILLYLGGRNAMPYIKKIIKAFDQPIRAEGLIIPLSLSLGAVEIPTHGTKINDLIAKADSAMYKAKAYDFSRAVFYIDEPTI